MTGAKLEPKPVAVVAGAGPGNGTALARRFALSGYAVAMLARDLERTKSLAEHIEGAHAFSCDLGEAKSVEAAFGCIRAELGEVDALLFNAGSGVFGNVESIKPEQFEEAWRVNAYGALLCAQQVMAPMKARGSGDIIFIGATASRRGGANTAAFAPAKAAQRSLAESMARTLWPSGVHVALIIIDGVVDLPQTRAKMPDKPDSVFVDPMGVAETAYQLTRQSPRAWSFEVEARPSQESW